MPVQPVLTASRRHVLAPFNQGHAVYLPRLQSALRDGSYRPGAIKRVLIPKADGGERPLGIPTVLDRVAQAAVLEVIEPSGGQSRRNIE